MPKKIDPKIRRAIERNAHKPISAPEMKRAIETLIAQGRLEGDAPSVRTISDILVRARQQPVEERYRITEVVWPETFDDETGLLPWAAAGAYFELLRKLDGRRPLMPLMRWFWRVTQAAPDAPISERHNMAALLALRECLPRLSLDVLETAQDPPAIETYLTFAPWRSDAAAKAYEKEVPKERRYEAQVFAWEGQQGSPEESIHWYAIELTKGVFTLDARETYIEYIKQHQTQQSTAPKQRDGRKGRT